MKKIYLTAASLLFFLNTIWAQNSPILELTQNYLISQTAKTGLNSEDLQELKVQTNYTDQKSNIEYAYVQQNLAGYPVYGAIANFAIKDGKVVYMTQTFQKDLHQRIGNQSAIQDLNVIANLVAQKLGFDLNETAFLNHSFKNELVYYANQDGKLDLSWGLHFNLTQDYQQKILEVIANAQTGEIYFQHNQLLSCNFEEGLFDNPMTEYKKTANIQWLENQFAFNPTNDGAKYNVYKLPVEAPSFGGREMVINPADANASPFGWHDVNGTAGADFTTTQGNNVIAVNDQNSAGISWLLGGNNSYVFTGFADGGEDLNFDFPIDLTQNMYQSKDASTTNLFYINNMMHDVAYQYGFTEAAGNFQANNYGKGGVGSDEVYAFGQTGESLGSMNNAMFGTPAEGSNPYMVMFMWTSNQGDSDLFAVNTPGSYQGDYHGLLASFGSGIPSPSLTYDLAVVKDDNANGGTDANDGCENITNATEINGKIALIKRGNCDFVLKVKSAQNAGAKAVVMVNNVASAPINMGGEDPTINIPAVMISMNDGNPIIEAILDGTSLNGSVPKQNHWDGYKDGSLDNGIVAHEYTHGISKRLTGGPSNSNCLNNDEQMGEGWSDYLALILTMKVGDQGTDGRGMGTYAVSQPTTGIGIRPTRYSTNISINPSTYNTVKTAAIPHGVGYVWTNMLWEMTWELIDEYGFDPNIYTGTGGNNIALQLVMDGMKLQPCSPGFVSGRDAILQADINNNDGVNQCRIWKAFAKRGLGFGADQGSVNSTTDGTQSFEMPPSEVLNCEGMGTNDLLNSSLSIYPNPTKGEFYILTDKSYQDAQISIQDLTGKTVYQTDVNLNNNRATININSLAVGVYVVKIKTETGVITKKLIKK